MEKAEAQIQLSIIFLHFLKHKFFVFNIWKCTPIVFLSLH